MINSVPQTIRISLEVNPLNICSFARFHHYNFVLTKIIWNQFLLFQKENKLVSNHLCLKRFYWFQKKQTRIRIDTWDDENISNHDGWAHNSNSQISYKNVISLQPPQRLIILYAFYAYCFRKTYLWNIGKLKYQHYKDIHLKFPDNIQYSTLSSPPVNLGESRSLKKFSTKILCKKLCLWTYCELDLLIFVCFSYLNMMN